MPREISESKIRRAIRRIERAKALAESEDDKRQLSDWEAEFVASLEARLEEYGSAFADPDKGDLSEPLSALQKRKIKEIEDKAKGKRPKSFKRGSGFKAKTPARRSYGRDDTPPEPLDPPNEEKPAPNGPAFRVIDGGKGED